MGIKFEPHTFGESTSKAGGWRRTSRGRFRLVVGAGLMVIAGVSTAGWALSSTPAQAHRACPLSFGAVRCDFTYQILSVQIKGAPVLQPPGATGTFTLKSTGDEVVRLHGDWGSSSLLARAEGDSESNGALRNHASGAALGCANDTDCDQLTEVLNLLNGDLHVVKRGSDLELFRDGSSMTLAAKP